MSGALCPGDEGWLEHEKAKSAAVSACIVTRGNVALDEIYESLPAAWEKLVWNNAAVDRDVAVFGRYAAVAAATHDVIYVQDDDCVLPPESIAALYSTHCAHPDALVANMPERFRGHYTDSCLVGFGAMFPRRLVAEAFARWDFIAHLDEPAGWFNRVCDVIFTTLTPIRVLVDVPYRDQPWATGDDRMYRQAEHVGERARALHLARAIRDA